MTCPMSTQKKWSPCGGASEADLFAPGFVALSHTVQKDKPTQIPDQ